jgi:methionyl-tRNA formyltransferase
VSLRAVFMGTPDFAVPTLARMVADGHDICTVYTQPPRKAGRGMAERKTPVHQFADAHGLPVRTPASLRSPDEVQAFEDLGADVAVVVAYGLILPQAVLDAPRAGCLNVHASLLPRWRGAAPIQRAIMAGDDRSGVAIMQIEAGLDTGPVLHQETTPIDDATTAGDLHDTLAELGAGAMSAVLARLDAGDPPPARPQSPDGVTYADKISKAEARIDFSKHAREVLRHVHGLSPFPGAWCMLPDTDGKPVRVKLLRVETVDAPTGAPGTVLDDQLAIACGTGAIRPLRLQREGKAAMDLKTFLNGLRPPVGARAA